MRIAFFGTSQFAADILSALIASGYECVAVVTKPDAPKGRKQILTPPPVKVIALEKLLHVPLFQPEKISDDEPTIEALTSLKNPENPLIFVVVAYGEILKKRILALPDIAEFGAINIHASLLPKYRGAAPIHRALEAGEVKTGVTIMKMVAKMDAGDILDVEEVEIAEQMQFAQLEELLCMAGKKALLRVLDKIQRGVITATVQDERAATFAAKIGPEDYRIDWARPARELHNKIRAIQGSYGYLGEKRLQILRAKALPDFNVKAVPGFLIQFDKSGMVVATGEGALQIEEVKLEGAKEKISYKALFNGHSSAVKLT